jgi:uncharacterized SAM-binding protein YcdF (DUF218 family)
LYILFWICMILSAISAVYYVIIIGYAGIHAAFSWFWLLLAMGGLLLCLFLHHLSVGHMMIAKQVKVIFWSAFLAGFFVFLVLEGKIIYYGNQKAKPGMDYLIVLGAQVKKTTVSKTLKKRLETAVVYLKENPQTKAIVSGGQGAGEDISEAEAMKQYLVKYKIAADRIILEDKSTNTYENICFSKKLLKKRNAAVAVVTNGFHIYRAQKIAEKQGIKHVQGLSAPTDSILLINYYVREAAGLLKDSIAGNL